MPGPGDRDVVHPEIMTTGSVALTAGESEQELDGLTDLEGVIFPVLQGDIDIVMSEVVVATVSDGILRRCVNGPGRNVASGEHTQFECSGCFGAEGIGIEVKSSEFDVIGGIAVVIVKVAVPLVGGIGQLQISDCWYPQRKYLLWVGLRGFPRKRRCWLLFRRRCSRLAVPWSSQNLQ